MHHVRTALIIACLPIAAAAATGLAAAGLTRRHQRLAHARYVLTDRAFDILHPEANHALWTFLGAVDAAVNA